MVSLPVENVKGINGLESSYKKLDTNSEDEQAESVDSGCVADITSEISWSQVASVLVYESTFIQRLVQHKTAGTIKNIEETKMEPLTTTTTTNDTTVLKDLENISNSLLLSKQKQNLRSDIRKLKKGKLRHLTAEQAADKQATLKKQLAVLECQSKKLKTKKLGFEIQSGSTPAVEEVKKIYNNCGKLVFSKFDFTDSGKDKWIGNKRGTDLKHAMTKVIKEKEKISALKEKGKINEAANRFEDKEWDIAMQRAGGAKIKDDASRIKQSLVKKQQRKKKSQKNWKEKLETVDKFRKMKVDKKKQNIAAKRLKKQQSKGRKKKGNKSKYPGF